MNANLLIEASAGTGKTHALATRLIELLRLGVEPREIVALTFSRAAAGEIFERFVSMLAEGAATSAEDAKLLRKVVSTQHLSQIGTLDSFLMRVVRSFPLELGLDGELEIMDDYRAGCERAKTSFAILRRTDGKTKRAFAEAFALAMNREDVRSFVDSYREFIRNWHELVLSHPAATAWGDPSAIWRDPPPGVFATDADLAAAADRIAAASSDARVAEFAEWVRSFRGAFTGVKGLAKKILEVESIFGLDSISVTFSKKEYLFTGRLADAVKDALHAVYGYVLRQKFELAKGVYTLISSYEAEYAKKVRGKGRLVFADVPRLIARLGEAERLALEYRMDAKIGAWALDEFQDTSREQWKALSPLIEEAKQSDGEKSLFVVGDRKQAIYGWRNGDVGIFTRERESGAYKTGELKKTYRSGPAVVKAVNMLFVDGPLKSEFPTWEAPVHETAKPELGGFVQTVAAGGTRKEDFIEPVYNALSAVDPVARGISAAVLVRSNDFGEMLVANLKAKGLKGIVWEGESAILDTPALRGFLDLVALADHPGDVQSYRHFATTPLAAAKFPGGVPPAQEVSAWAALEFTARGLVRTFRELRALLPEKPEAAWSEFTEVRFTDMLRAAAEFELSMEPGVRLSDFEDFIAAKKKRNLAEPGKVKVMTIHRSKGLGFDYVVLPLYEHRALNAEPGGPLVSDDWVLPDPGPRVVKAVDGLSDAHRLRRDREEQEALCAYYVAMTRAKRAMTIVVQPPPKTDTGSRRMSDFVRMSLPAEIGDREWHLKFVPEKDDARAEREMPAPKRGPRNQVSRRLPSQAFHTGMSAGALFLSDGSRKAAMERGTAVHAALEGIEWIDPSAPRDDLERRILATEMAAAFTRPADLAGLWRERSFEIVSGGRWTSGQFDRVVFTGSGEGRKAAIYDFKTNRKMRGESDEEFASRMRAAYAGQMAAYREAVHSLTGIAPENITAALLLVENGSVVSSEL